MMKFTPLQYNYIRSLLEPKIEELRKKWKESKDEEETDRLGDELANALRAADTIEEYYNNQ